MSVYDQATPSNEGGQSWGDLVLAVAAEFDHVPTDEDIDHILWEHTGFPCFWQGDPATDCARQVRAYYEHPSETEQGDLTKGNSA